MKITNVDIDLAKLVLQVHGIDKHDQVIAARRLHQGNFVWLAIGTANLEPQCQQLSALVLDPTWQRLGNTGVITVI